MIHISRKLRLYISDVSDLSPEAILNLERMVNFIMAVFVEFWIRVKRWPNIADAASHYLFLITRLRDLDLVTQETVRPVFQRGGYCLHEESLLLSLLCSPDLHQRMFAVIFLQYCFTGCPILLGPLSFCHFLGFWSTYRGTFHSHWIANEILILKLTLFSILREILTKLQHKT